MYVDGSRSRSEWVSVVVMGRFVTFVDFFFPFFTFFFFAFFFFFGVWFFGGSWVLLYSSIERDIYLFYLFILL